MTCLVMSDDEQFRQWATMHLPQPPIFYADKMAMPHDVTVIIWHEQVTTHRSQKCCEQLKQLDKPILYFVEQFNEDVNSIVPYVFDFLLHRLCLHTYKRKCTVQSNNLHIFNSSSSKLIF